jgi:hypothetical protein
MKIIDCIQGSDEWFKARCGIPTASEFSSIITTQGKTSKSREKYMYQIAGERLLGKSVEGYTNGNMQRGQELEAEAREAYEIITSQEVRQVGFCLSDNGLYGVSPDGLIGDEGGLEIKCPTLPVHILYLLENKLPTDYIQQVQGQLLVTGRKWVDFFSYFPGIKPLIVRVYPDKEFIKMLRVELEVFCIQLKEVVEKLK